ncbi:MAG: flagellar biosynthetic protein FliR [Pseudomonadales bacterium]|nr:flagellar biosynthetic protein FliR [Pseudomonadales bacterium]
MEIALQQLYEWMGQLFYPFCRIGAFFLAVPIIGTQLVPTRIRLALALATTILVAATLPRVPDVDPFSGESFLIVAHQLLLGVALGFLVQMLFHIFVIGGQAVAMQNGLGFGTLVDPVNGINVTSISQLYLMSTNLLFFSFNGHLAIIELLTQSFYAVPITTEGIDTARLFFLVEQGSWMFRGAVLVALPAVTSLLVVNFTFGVMSRVAPQMNIIAIGFPFTMVTGLVIIWLTLGNILPQFERLTEETYVLLRSMMT